MASSLPLILVIGGGSIGGRHVSTGFTTPAPLHVEIARKILSTAGMS